MDRNQVPKRIAVIGGGLAGLSAAHRLSELKAELDLNLEITLFEAGPRLGGIVGTEQIGDYLVDIGADSFLTNKPGAVSLCRRLGIEDRLIPTDSRFRGALVLYDGRPVRVPEGFQLLCPNAIWPIVTTPILSVWGKLRLLMEWFVPRKQPKHNDSKSDAAQSSLDETIVDESLADFSLRRFGREALDRLIQPLVGGIYTSDPEKLSLAATLPRFLEMERDHGSLIKASLFSNVESEKPEPLIGRTESASSQSRVRPAVSSGARYGLFAGLIGGMNDLVETLGASVRSACHVRLSTQIISVEQEPGHSTAANNGRTGFAYRLTFADGTQDRFDAVIIATSGALTAKLVTKLDVQLSDELSQIEFASSALVVTGHRLEDIRHPLDAFGLVIPHVERRRILAVSFSSRKFSNRAPAGHVLLRTFVGGALQPELFLQNDEQMIQTVREELLEIFGVRGEPDFVRVYRYKNAMPQYHVGHLDRVRRIQILLSNFPGFSLAGISYQGVGVPDVISGAERAAEDVLNEITAVKLGKS